MESHLVTIDVAHPPRPADAVEAALVEAWSQVRNSDTLRILKIIHGHGSSGRGGSTREVVRSWLFRRREKFKGVIQGEQYGLFDASTREMWSAVGNYHDTDLDRGNAGITVVWVR